MMKLYVDFLKTRRNVLKKYFDIDSGRFQNLGRRIGVEIRYIYCKERLKI